LFEEQQTFIPAPKKWEMRGKTFSARTRKCEWADKEGGGGKKELCS